MTGRPARPSAVRVTIGAALTTLAASAVFLTTASIADNGKEWAAASWRSSAQRRPIVGWPKEIAPIDIGSDISVNGLPLQLQAFVSTAPPDEVARWFRRSLGQPLLENRLDGQLVLGRLQGTHYLTVQLEPAGKGTRGLLGITDLQVGHDAPRSDAERWFARWPAGSRVYSRVSSWDAGRLSRHTVIVNGHGEALNAERIKAVLAEDGYTFEREAVPGENRDRTVPEELPASRVLFFKGGGGEAVATVHRDAQGHTAIVLNTISRPERGQ